MKPSNSSTVCAACGDRIGVYEPIWVEQADGTHTCTGLLELDQSSQRQPHAFRLYHLACLTPSELADASAA